jgi:hypothetical protein
MADLDTIECFICCEDKDDRLMVTPCKCRGFHIHEECLATAIVMKRSSKCSVCKSQFEPEDWESFSEVIERVKHHNPAAENDSVHIRYNVSEYIEFNVTEYIDFMLRFMAQREEERRRKRELERSWISSTFNYIWNLISFK